MPKAGDIVRVPEEGCHSSAPPAGREDGLEIPWDRLDPDTLRNLIGEFVTREWEELGDASRYTLDDKIDQVYLQLRHRQAKIVYDQRTESCNIVPC